MNEGRADMKPSLVVAFLLLFLLPGCAPEPDSLQPYPIWDGKESVEDYARRTHLPPTDTLDLGDGVTIDLVLIPAAVAGNPPPAPDVTIASAKVLAWITALVFLILLVVFVNVKRPGKWFSFS